MIKIIDIILSFIAHYNIYVYTDIHTHARTYIYVFVSMYGNENGYLYFSFAYYHIVYAI